MMRPRRFGLILILIGKAGWCELKTPPAIPALQPRTFSLGVTRDRPFEAQFTQTYTVKAPDGAKQSKTTTGIVARDRAGRVRIESKTTDCGQRLERATIYDPAERRMSLLDLVSRTAIVTVLMDVAMELRPGWIFPGLRTVDGYQGVADPVAGVMCKRLKFDLVDGPEGGFADVWVSDKLHQVMRERVSSVHEEFTWTISEIHQIEPDPRLFRAPKDFKRTEFPEWHSACQVR